MPLMAYEQPLLTIVLAVELVKAWGPRGLKPPVECFGITELRCGNRPSEFV